MVKQIMMVLLTILFKLKMNSAGSVNYAINKDTGVAQAIVPAVKLEQKGNTLYYFAYTMEGSWFQAMEFCKGLNMDLVSIETEEENNFLFDQMTEFFGDTDEYRFWTSGTTLAYNKLVWMGTGRPIVYGNWYPGEPNNSGNDEKCIEIAYSKKGLQWNDVNQIRRRHALCEAKITKSVTDMVSKLCSTSTSVKNNN
ncbi:perlucin-like [Diabrotica virgifera virgifera]|uniref:Perlucin-like n=1 Tax=Diabrotica virgifera virgifera TaxID=50390 RepID=A0A6P7FTA1_DIAVI|nr:perlucin-like [Diabrotica virgifera virgifera]